MKISIPSIISVTLLATALSAGAVRHEPFDRSRIYWDSSTRCTPIPSPSGYGRIIELNDGRLLMMGGAWGRGVEETYSSDRGKTWTTPKVVIGHGPQYEYCNPDFIQLSDGTLLLGVNPRPFQPYSEDRPFSIDVMRSTDNGETWGSLIRVHTAYWEGFDGCWEPAFLELPSGEVHCYFSLELVNSNDQEIMMSRSFDKGLTWTPAKRVSYRKGHRDGMPVVIITDNDEIVVTIEDNGQPGYDGFRATSFRCTLEENWANDMWIGANSPNRSKLLIEAEDLKYRSAGPYIRKLPNGETVASWMGEKAGLENCSIDFYNHLVAVGDADARNFKCTNTSFYVPEGGRANWGSINVDKAGYVYAVAGTYEGGQVNGNSVIRGRALKGFEAAWGTPVLDASFKKDPYAFEGGRQLTMGSQTGNRLEMDFLYDNENLYFYLFAQDKEILLDEPIDKDGIFLSLDVAGCCDTYPQEGIFKFFFGANGDITMRRGNANKWQAEEPAPESVKMEKKVGRTYYMMECAIPWSVLGEKGAPEPSRVMRINVQQRDRRTKKLLYEKIPDAVDRSSWTWPEFRLIEDAGVEAPVADVSRAVVKVSGSTVTVESTREVASLSAVNLAGAVVATAQGNLLDLSASGLFVISVRYADGSLEHHKIVL